MAINPLEIDTYRIVNDPSMSPEQKSAAIDSLWGPPAVAMPTAGPDTRLAFDAAAPLSSTASVPDASTAPPAPPPVASDVPAGGMSVAPPPAAPIGPSVSAPNMSTIAPQDLAAAAASKASTAPPPVAPGPSPQEVADARFNATVGQLTANALRGSPGVKVAAHDQPVSSLVERTAPIPEDIKERIATSQQAEQGLALEKGDIAAKAAEDAAKQAEEEAKRLHAQEADQRQKDEYAKAHLSNLDDQFEKLRKDTELEPNAWWTHRDTGHKILALIAAGMFGLGGDPDGVARMVKRDTEALGLERDKKLSAFRQRIENFKGQMLSPEAANAAEQSLGLRAAAAEARRLAASAAAPEARANAMQQAQALETQAAMYDAQVAQNEAGAVKQTIQHVPAHIVGGTPGGLVGLKKLKEAGINPEGALRSATGGEYAGSGMTSEQLAQAKDEVNRRVEFPETHDRLYASSPAEAEQLRGVVRGVAEIKNAYRMLRQELGANGHSVSPKTLARVNAIIANNTVNLKDAAKLGVLSKSDLDLIAPLTGKNVNDTISLDSSTLSGIDTADSMLGTKTNVIRKTLYQTPFGQKTGGTAAADVEVQK